MLLRGLSTKAKFPKLLHLSHLCKQGAPKSNGHRSSIGPGPTTVVSDIHHRTLAQEGHIRRHASNRWARGDTCARDSYPITIDHKPQLRLKAGIWRLCGEEELVDSIDGGFERAGSPVKASAHVHQHLAVFDPVHFANQLARERCKEVDFCGWHWARRECIVNQ